MCGRWRRGWPTLVSRPSKRMRAKSRDPGAARFAAARMDTALRASCAGSRISFRSRKRARCTRPGHEGGMLVAAAVSVPRMRCAPSPACGGGLGWGQACTDLFARARRGGSLAACPLPVPPPQAGEGLGPNQFAMVLQFRCRCSAVRQASACAVRVGL
jgi:hypothetical protein